MGWKTKEERKEYNKKYYEKNRQKILLQKKEYAKRKEDEIKQKQVAHREKHRERLAANCKKWRKENPDKIKKYNESEHGIKINKKHEWKRHGVNIDDFEEMYKRHISITNCEVCNCLLTIDKKITPTTKCLDHNHITGYYRHTICNNCNVDRGIIDKKYRMVIKELECLVRLSGKKTSFF